MPYNNWEVAGGDKPTANKWNQLGDNDAGLKTGEFLDNDSIGERHIKEGPKVPIGGVVMWAGNIGSVPNGYHLCDGSALSRSIYSVLFSAIGTNFGNGNGSTTFNIPDMRARFMVGAGSTYNQNDKGGANSHRLTINEMPSHDHGVSESPHNHKVPTRVGGNSDWPSFDDQWTTNGKFEGQTSSVRTNLSINNKGGGNSHENRPAYIAIGFIIRVE